MLNASLHFKRSLDPTGRVRGDPDVVSAGGNNPVHSGIIRTEVIRFHRKIDRLVFARFKCDALESLQLAHWARSWRDSIVHIELHNFSACAFSSVLNFSAHVNGSVLRNWR